MGSKKQLSTYCSKRRENPAILVTSRKINTRPYYYNLLNIKVGWLCFTFHRQQGRLETAPPFTVPCEGREDWFYTILTGNRTPDGRVVVHYTTAAPRQLHLKYHN